MIFLISNVHNINTLTHKHRKLFCSLLCLISFFGILKALFLEVYNLKNLTLFLGIFQTIIDRIFFPSFFLRWFIICSHWFLYLAIFLIVFTCLIALYLEPLESLKFRNIWSSNRDNSTSSVLLKSFHFFTECIISIILNLFYCVAALIWI